MEGYMTITPIACTPAAIPADVRGAHFALAARLFGGHVRERRDLPHGIELRFDAEDLADVARFVADERRCCPFLHIHLELLPDDGPLWLRLTGPPGTREFMAAELRLDADA
jgi:hypothetical protein